MGDSDTVTLEMKRRMPAPRPVVFQAFADPKQVANWFGPKGFTVAEVEFDARVGQRYRIEMEPPEGEHFVIAGQVREADPPNRLAFTFITKSRMPTMSRPRFACRFSMLATRPTLSSHRALSRRRTAERSTPRLERLVRQTRAFPLACVERALSGGRRFPAALL